MGGRDDMMARTLAEWQENVRYLKDDMLEQRYRERGPVYFAHLVRRSRVLAVEEVVNLLESAAENGRLSAHEASEVGLADLVIRGRRREDNAEVYLVVEVSWGVWPYDVERAAHRADPLRHAGMLAVPVVAGKTVLPEAVSRARQLEVWQVTDGQAAAPEP
jgi:hypothetical protein